MFARLVTSAATVSATAAALVAASVVAAAAPAGTTAGTPAAGISPRAGVAASSSTLPSTFMGCGVWSVGADAKGTMRWTGIANTQPSTETILGRNTESMGFVPRAFTDTAVFTLGDSRPYFLAVAPNGYLWSYAIRESDPAWGVEGRSEWVRFPLTPGWKSFTALTASDNTEATDGAPTYLFGLTAAGTLRRYSVEVTDNHEGVVVLGGKTVSTHVADLKAMTWDRSQRVGGKVSDVLLVTTKSGKLQEIVIPRTGTLTATRHTLRSSGWATFDSISTGFCEFGARAILGTTKSGAGYVYRDAKRTNFSAADFSRGYAVPVTTGTHFSG